jgi:hypothetical protein
LNGDTRTEDWKLYDAGKQYNNKLKPSYYEQVDANIAFFHGDQWRNLDVANMPTPVFNIIKRCISFFVASLTSSKTKLHFEPLMLANNQDSRMQREVNAAEIANAQVSNLLEKFKFDFKIKETLFDGAITGDSAAHFYFDTSLKPYGNAYSDIRGEICMEMVDGTNVFFGNANNPRIDIQPYIIISGRDMVKNLKEEAARYKTDQQEINTIESDNNFSEQAGDSGKIEVEADEYGKALYIIVYRKKKMQREVVDGFGNKTIEEYTTITATKSVENAYIYKDIDTGLTQYPISWFNWEKQKNQYHGRALCTGILPNQIFINRMFAMVMYHLMISAFPKAVYNSDLITSWNNDIGAAIGIRGMGHDVNVNNIAGYLKPGDMSNQIVQVIDMAINYTKETLGISDAALGNIDPKNTSAIIAVQKSASIPLENPKANLYEFIEDIGKILFDMMGTYYGSRPVLIDQAGQKSIVNFNFSLLKDMFLNVRADVGESTYWSELAAVQTLDNLLMNGHIEIIDYLKRVPEEYIPQKQELISKIEQNMAMMQQQASDPMNIISQLPPEEQEAFMNAPPEQQQAMLAQLQQSQAPTM